MPVSMWHKATTILLGLILLLLGVITLRLFVAAWRTTPVTVELLHDCRATANTFLCSFTNLSDTPARGMCVKGKLQPKSGGPSDVGATLCSGVIGPRESKSVDMPLEGKAAETCHDANGLLDFGSCTLDVDTL